MSEALGEVVRLAMKAERIRAGLSQDQLGVALGVSRAVISTMETGRRAITLAETPELCAALGIPLHRLLQDADPQDLERLGLR